MPDAQKDSLAGIAGSGPRCGISRYSPACQGETSWGSRSGAGNRNFRYGSEDSHSSRPVSFFYSSSFIG